MKKYLLIIPLFAANFFLFSQQTLFFDDFESYNDGDIVANFSALQGFGANGAGVAVNDPGNGAGGSDQYLLTPSGYNVTQFVTTVSPGETYKFALNGALTGSNANGIKFQIIQLHGAGNSDDEIRVDFTLASVGGGQQNVFKLIDTSYTAVATDTGNIVFRILKNWGPAYKIDNLNIICNSCIAPLPDLRIINVLVDSSQSSSCDLSSSAEISVDLDNNGNESIFGFDVNYSLNNSNPISETFSDTIAPGNNFSVSLSQMIDLGWDGSYNLVVYGNTANDTISFNDTVFLSLENFSSHNSYDFINDCDSITWIDGITYTSNTDIPQIAYNDFENYNDNDDISIGLDYSSYGNGSTINTSVDSGQGAYFSNGFAVMDSSGFGAVNWDINVVSGETYEFKTYMKPGNFNSASLSLRINKGGNDVVTANHPGGNEWEEVVINWTADTTGQVAFRLVKTYGIAYFDEIEINQTSLTPTQMIYTSVNGCDSIITLDLTINNGSSIVIPVIECDSFVWEGVTYDSTGTYTNIYTGLNGCDSSVTLDLTINSGYSIVIPVVECDSFIWDGVTYNSSGNYSNVYTDANGCDSLVTYNLTLTNSNVGTETIVACDSATWNGTTYTSSGNYSLVGLNNNAGCDSTVNLVLTISNSSSSLLTNSGCIAYPWNGQNYTNSGTYTYIGTNAVGCPQYDTLVLTITTTASSLTKTKCNSFSWYGSVYSQSGTYYSNSACVDTLFLTINSSDATSSSLTVCDTLTWIDGITYSASGTYNFITSNNVGCDSSVTLNLIVDSSKTNLKTIVACDSLNWNGTTYTSSGNYSYTTTGSNTCDSTVNLVLTINSSSFSNSSVTECGSYDWIVNGNTYNYTSSGVYSDSSTNAVGCPQYDTLALTINPEYNDTITLITCDIFAWGGVNYTTSGFYSYLYSSINNCDSLVTLDLNIYNSNSSIQTVTACDSITWIDGITYTSNTDIPQIAYNDFENYNDNDDISIGLDYSSYGNGSTINTSVDSGQGAYFSNGFAVMDSSGFGAVNWDINVVSGETYEFKTYMKPGNFNSASLSLRINKGGNDVVTANHPGGNEWEEVVINWTADTTGQVAFRLVKTYGIAYFDEIEINQTSLTPTQMIYTSVNGCDSIITLDLTINNGSSIVIPVIECDSFVWEGVTYDSTGTYTNIYTGLNGCDSSVTLDLTINNSSFIIDTLVGCDSLTWIDGITYTSSNNTATYALSTSNNCDSIIILNLNLLESTSAQISDTSNLGVSYDFNGTILDSNGIYVQILTNSVGCDSIITLDLTFISGIESQLENKIHIYPNPGKDQLTISSDVVIGKLFLRNLQGKIVKNTLVNKNKLKLDISDLNSGIYILEFNNGSIIWNKKIIITN